MHFVLNCVKKVMKVYCFFGPYIIVVIIVVYWSLSISCPKKEKEKLYHRHPFGISGVLWLPVMFYETVIYLVLPWPALPYFFFFCQMRWSHQIQQESVGDKFTNPQNPDNFNSHSLVGRWRFHRKKLSRQNIAFLFFLLWSFSLVMRLGDSPDFLVKSSVHLGVTVLIK